MNRLAPEGQWVTVGSYGRCWRPGGVATDWRPYCNGSWQETDAGWYWVSDEPWAWATYHYGRWDYTDQYGWYWVPQTQWAPAWVSWHEGGGYVGWAPLQPSVSISVNGFVGFDESRISPRAFVFVKQGQFLDPIRPSIVVVNNTTVINKTRTVTNTKIVNNKVINEGPATAAIEKAMEKGADGPGPATSPSVGSPCRCQTTGIQSGHGNQGPDAGSQRGCASKANDCGTRASTRAETRCRYPRNDSPLREEL